MQSVALEKLYSSIKLIDKFSSTLNKVSKSTSKIGGAVSTVFKSLPFNDGKSENVASAAVPAGIPNTCACICNCTANAEIVSPNTSAEISSLETIPNVVSESISKIGGAASTVFKNIFKTSGKKSNAGSAPNAASESISKIGGAASTVFKNIFKTGGKKSNAGSAPNAASESISKIGGAASTVFKNIFKIGENNASNAANAGPVADIPSPGSAPAAVSEATISVSGTLNEAMNGIQGTVANLLQPAIESVNNQLSGLLDKFFGLVQTCPTLQWLFSALTNTVSVMVQAWDLLQVAMEIGESLRNIGNEINSLCDKILGNTAATKQMTTAQKINAAAGKIWQKTTATITKLTQSLRLNLLWNKVVIIASAVWSKILGAAQWVMSSGFWASCAAVWGFTASLLACPVTWIVIGVMALIGAIVALIYYWDEVTGFVKKYAKYLSLLAGPMGWIISAFSSWDVISSWLGNIWNAFKKVCPNIANLLEKLFAIFWAGVQGSLDFWKGVWSGIVNFFTESWNGITSTISAGIEWISSMGGGIWDGILGGIEGVYNWLSDMLVPVIQFVGSMFEWLGGLGAVVWKAIKGVFSGIDGFIGSVLRTLSKIPGLGFLDPDVQVNGTKVERPAVPTVQNQRNKDIPAGGLRSNTSNKTTNYGGVTINTTQPVGPGQMEEMWLMEA